MTHIERGKFIADLTTGYETDRVFPQREVKVNIPFYVELSDGFSCQPHFADSMIMKHITFAFGKFSAHKYFVFIVFVGRQAAVHIHQCVLADFIGSKCGQTGFGIFVETFEQGNTDGVLDSYIGGTVVGNRIVGGKISILIIVFLPHIVI